MTHIFKNIFNRRIYSIALIIEIIIVSIIGWMVIEPVAVDSSIAMQPAGYDYDRLIKINYSYLGKGAVGYDSLANGEEADRQARENILNMLRNREGVEHATYTTFQSFDSDSYSRTAREADSIYYKEGDEYHNIEITILTYFPNTDFFETFGIRGANGEIFREPETTEDSYIISSILKKGCFPNESVIGKDFNPPHYYNENWPYHPTPIAGVTSDLKYRKDEDRQGIVIKPVSSDNSSIDGYAVRLKEGVNPHTFLDRLKADLKDYRSGNMYLRTPALFSEMRADLFMEKQRQLTQKWIIVGFFLFNVLLGIAGTFYIQCRKRIPEAGIRRAFGSTRAGIEFGIIAEAWVTVVIGWGIGCAIYLGWLLYFKEPMYGEVPFLKHVLDPHWYDTPVSRYSIVSGIVLLLLLLTATIGAWLPARKVGHADIVEALRDE